MKCMCGDPSCVSEVNFDSGCGLIIAEGNPGAAAAGVYLDLQGAVELARQLRAFVLAKLDEPKESRFVSTETGH